MFDEVNLEDEMFVGSRRNDVGREDDVDESAKVFVKGDTYFLFGRTSE